MPSESDLPASLAQLPYRNAISIRPDPDFSCDLLGTTFTPIGWATTYQVVSRISGECGKVGVQIPGGLLVD